MVMEKQLNVKLSLNSEFVCQPVAVDALLETSFSATLMSIIVLMFNDGEMGLPWTERVVSSNYACT